MSIEDRADDEFWHAGRLRSEGKVHAAYTRVLEALEINPEHELATLLLGELYLWKNEDLGLEQRQADGQALDLFEKVIRREPHHAEAMSLKALALLHLERFAEALEVARKGLDVLPLRVGYAMSTPEVYTNVAEQLYDVMVRALLELERRPEAFAALSAGLRACPKSKYLTALVDYVSPVTPPEPK
jgi:tetratricopeptide (TPR) repeat protein